MTRGSQAAGGGASANPDCRSCHKQIRADNNDSYLTCLKCKDTYHMVCLSMHKGQYDAISKNPQIHWLCLLCNNTIEKDMQQLASLDDKIHKVNDRFGSLEKDIATMKRLLTDHTGNPQRTSETGSWAGVVANGNGPTVVTAAKSKDSMSQLWMEMEDKKRREKNVMFSGMPEPKGTTPDGRRHEDIDNVRACLQNLGLSAASEDVSIDHCFRIGKPDPARPRLLKVVLGSLPAKLEICQKARTLRNVQPDSLYANCYINPDRTPSEHIAYLEIRKQRKARAEKRVSPATSTTQTVSGELAGGPQSSVGRQQQQ